mmetsp:Transcript_18341/g.56029  ORF Transcript_18341/g.56029 Transcript_18341/m.56029 type:complete len:254 (-) Transcript_18341:557-1318(-)
MRPCGSLLPGGEAEPSKPSSSACCSGSGDAGWLHGSGDPGWLRGSSSASCIYRSCSSCSSRTSSGSSPRSPSSRGGGMLRMYSPVAPPTCVNCVSRRISTCLAICVLVKICSARLKVCASASMRFTPCCARSICSIFRVKARPESLLRRTWHILCCRMRSVCFFCRLSCTRSRYSQMLLTSTTCTRWCRCALCRSVSSSGSRFSRMLRSFHRSSVRMSSTKRMASWWMPRDASDDCTATRVVSSIFSRTCFRG